MDRVYESNPSSDAPAAPNPALLGYPQEGATPTVPGAWWFHMITEELRTLLVAAGIAPSATAVNQVASAVTTLINSALAAFTIAANKVIGLAASATTDTTNAGNISSGTLNNARLPTSIAVTGSISAGNNNWGGAGALSASFGAGGSGVVYLGTASTYLYFSGSAYVMPSYPVQAGGFQVTSDESLKFDIAPIAPADSLKIIRQIGTYSFRLKSTGNLAHGVLAQNVERVLPHAVSVHKPLGEDGKEIEEGVRGVDLVPLVAHLIGSVSALEERLAALEAR